VFVYSTDHLDFQLDLSLMFTQTNEFHDIFDNYTSEGQLGLGFVIPNLLKEVNSIF